MYFWCAKNMRQRRVTREEASYGGSGGIVGFDAVGGLGDGLGFPADSGKAGERKGASFGGDLCAWSAARAIHSVARSGDCFSGRLPLRARGFSDEREDRAGA